MIDPTTSATIVALSAIALLILLNALRKTFVRNEWDAAALFGALAVLSVILGSAVVTYRGEWTIIVNRFQTEFLLSDWGRWSVYIANIALAIASAVIFLRAVRQNTTTFNPAAVLFLVVAIVSSLSAVLHGDNPIQPYSVLFLIVLVACTVAPRGLGIHIGIGTCCMIAAIASGLTLAAHADFSVLACTYKCGALDFMFRGIFVHENALGMFLAIAMPFVYIAFDSWEGPALSAYLLGLILVSGSRLAAVAGVITFLALILVRPNIRRPTWAPTKTALLYGSLVVTFIVGVTLPFYTDDPAVLSDRGQIWMVARSALADPATLLHGTGMLGWQQEVQEFGLNYSYSVHNQWLQVLYTTGLIGLLLVVAAVAMLIRHAGRTYSLVVLCVLLPVFILSVAEQPWPVDLANWLIWAVVGALLCYPATRHFSGGQVTDARQASGGLVGDVAAIGGPKAISSRRRPGHDKGRNSS